MNLRFLLAAAVAFTAAAQVIPDQYIVQLSAEPAASLELRARSARRTAITREQQRLRRIVESNGGEVLDTFNTVYNGMAVRLAAGAAARLRTQPGVARVTPDRLERPLLDRAVPLQNIAAAWQRIGGMQKAGAGIKIGIIDTGIDISHPAFQDPELAVPDGFPKVNQTTDLAYTNSKVIVARAYVVGGSRQSNPAQDRMGHGTATAMVAGGGLVTGPLGPVAGVAPKAWLGNYKVFPDGQTGAPTSLILRALEDAVNDGMDVINLSLGHFPSSRPFDEPNVIAVENAIAAGKIVTVASGNEGSDLNTISAPASAPSAITVGSSWNDRVLYTAGVILGEQWIAGLPGNGSRDHEPVTAPLKDVADIDPTERACSELPQTSLSGAIAVISRGACTFREKIDNAERAGAVAAVIYALPDSPDAPNMDVAGAPLPALSISNSGAATLRDAARENRQATLAFFGRTTAIPTDPAQISGFSSRGPNSDYGVKPDMIAVGSMIYTASPIANGSWAIASGTSFSAPAVAGAAALLIGARPALGEPQYRSLLVNAASPFPSDPSAIAPQIAGAGRLDMTAALSSTVTVSPVSISFGPGGSTVDVTRKIRITNLGSDSDTFSISASPITGSAVPTLTPNSVEIAAGQTAEVTVQFAGTSLDPGAYDGFLRIEGTRSPVVARVPYWYGAPSQKPKTIQIFDPPETVRHGAELTLDFRVLDPAGLPVTDGVDRSVFAAGDVLSIESSDADVPGSFTARIQAPATPGLFTIRLVVGGVSKEVSITAQ